jgi:hypothetical protein
MSWGRENQDTGTTREIFAANYSRNGRSRKRAPRLTDWMAVVYLENTLMKNPAKIASQLYQLNICKAPRMIRFMADVLYTLKPGSKGRFFCLLPFLSANACFS